MKGIVIVAVAAVLVTTASVGLRVLEEKQQKPRVVKALLSLISDAAAEQYKLDGVFQTLEDGKISYTCNGKITSLSETLIDESWRFLIPYLKQTTFRFALQKDETLRQAEFTLEADWHGWKEITLEGYLDDAECIVHVPQLHESYLSFSPDNLEQQYEKSLLYTVLGDTISLPQKNLEDFVFSGIEQNICEEWELLCRNLSDNLELAKQLYEEIVVTKTEKKEEVLWNGRYESCTAYQMQIPAGIVNRFLESDGRDTRHTLRVDGEEWILWIYLNKDKKILKLETEQSFLVDGTVIPVSLAFFPKGVDNAWDSALLETEILWQEVTYGFRLVCSNEFVEGERILHAGLSLAQPYVTEFLDMDVTYQPEQGTVVFDFSCKTPFLSADGIASLAPVTELLQKPQQESVRIFELKLFDVLKFTNGLNWNLFKNKE